MKKAITILYLAVLMQTPGYAQDSSWLNNIYAEDSDWLKTIKTDQATSRHDTSRTLTLAEFANYYKFKLPDSSLIYGNEALRLARQIHYIHGELKALSFIGLTQTLLGNDSKAFQIALRQLKIAEENNLPYFKALAWSSLGFVYERINDHEQAVDYGKKSLALFDSIGSKNGSVIARNLLVGAYLKLNQPGSALYYNLSLAKAREITIQKEDGGWIIYQSLWNLGMIEAKKGNTDLALTYLRQTLFVSGEIQHVFNSLFAIAEVYRQAGNTDSCIHYAERSLDIMRGRGFYSNIIKADLLLSSVYETKDPRKALEYSTRAIAYKDSLENLEKIASFESSIAFDEQERRYEIETANTKYRNQLRQYALMAGLLVFLLIVFILYRNNKNKQQAKERIEKAYDALKATQTQLIQSEKMASLGSLTAGIAHEIQNPLNFVNNFSEVNSELINEMADEADKGNTTEVRRIAHDIKQNLEKINHHGKRADAIVKGMLQHSRTSSGMKEPTDINALADEYLRLAYHGLRAKDKSFNAKIETDFDPSAGRITIIPQDIGRALLNLINNAFYAVHEKKKTESETRLPDLPTALSLKLQRSEAGQAGGQEYEPTVTVSTKRANERIQISVADNGSGIPQNITDKIFQPFFTTKPTGQGTGLGLSLAYDIVKAHGGEITVETKEGNGSKFIIQLPVTPIRERELDMVVK